jgi:hypothetical protein
MNAEDRHQPEPPRTWHPIPNPPARPCKAPLRYRVTMGSLFTLTDNGAHLDELIRELLSKGAHASQIDIKLDAIR